MASEIPTDVKALLDQQQLLPAVWYVGPLQSGGPRHSDGPARPIDPLPLPSPATAPSDSGEPAPEPVTTPAA